MILSAQWDTGLHAIAFYAVALLHLLVGAINQRSRALYFTSVAAVVLAVLPGITLPVEFYTRVNAALCDSTAEHRHGFLSFLFLRPFVSLYPHTLSLRLPIVLLVCAQALFLLYIGKTWGKAGVLAPLLLAKSASFSPSIADIAPTWEIASLCVLALVTLVAFDSWKGMQALLATIVCFVGLFSCYVFLVPFVLFMLWLFRKRFISAFSDGYLVLLVLFGIVAILSFCTKAIFLEERMEWDRSVSPQIWSTHIAGLLGILGTPQNIILLVCAAFFALTRRTDPKALFIFLSVCFVLLGAFVVLIFDVSFVTGGHYIIPIIAPLVLLESAGYSHLLDRLKAVLTHQRIIGKTLWIAMCFPMVILVVPESGSVPDIRFSRANQEASENLHKFAARVLNENGFILTSEWPAQKIAFWLVERRIKKWDLCEFFSERTSFGPIIFFDNTKCLPKLPKDRIPWHFYAVLDLWDLYCDPSRLLREYSCVPLDHSSERFRYYRCSNFPPSHYRSSARNQPPSHHTNPFRGYDKQTLNNQESQTDPYLGGVSPPGVL